MTPRPLLLIEHTWPRPSRARPHTGNRLVAMRVRDARRWVHRYRLEAEQRALESAKRRSLLDHLFSTVRLVHMLYDDKRRGS